jgi:hypothetical protein
VPRAALYKEETPTGGSPLLRIYLYPTPSTPGLDKFTLDRAYVKVSVSVRLPYLLLITALSLAHPTLKRRRTF